MNIRELVFGDLDDVFDTLRPETSGGRVFVKKTRAEADRWLRNRMAEQSALGYSIWGIETKRGDFIGVCGLIPWEPGPMICYAVRRDFQGNGFGTEAAEAVINSASDHFDLVISTVRDTNTASIRVAQKIGMRTSETAFSDDPALLSFVFP
ncbi:MAG: GNAT family N-acetyltransferase [Pseudomonadota bacterium]